MKISLFNTLTRKKEKFEPVEPGKVRLYTCGPTVYDYAHIGNLRTYVFEDVLRRTLEAADYAVTHVMNVTDVGHLQSDADEGEDKVSVAAKRQKKTPEEIARFYEKIFFEDCEKLHILPSHHIPRATDHVDDMIQFIKVLEEKGFTYTVDGNVYFRIKKMPHYGALARLDLQQQQAGARVAVDEKKEDPHDFVLWFSKSKFPNQIQQWESPWGRGFPGWHIECSVMSSKYLGDRIDIHCGGIDHIPVHHTNEIAQSEAFFGKPWVNVWLHGEFLLLDKGKMAKSEGGFLTLSSLLEKGYLPDHYRYFCLTAHYRSQLVFSWENLDAAKNAFENLRNRVISWKLNPTKGSDESIKEMQKEFWNALYDDLDMPKALAVLWNVAKNTKLSSAAKMKLVEDFDRVLGFDVQHFQKPPLSEELMRLIAERETARQKKEWNRADELRDKLSKRGVQLKDTANGTEWYLSFD